MAQVPLNADLDIIAESDIQITVDKLTGDLDIIQKLDDEPNDVGGLTAAQLKAKFDEAGNIIKTYINETLVPEVLSEGITEAQRAENEAARQAAEAARVQAEQSRADAETARGTAESGRAGAESGRASAEAGRVQAESDRASAESARASAESGRASAETGRAQAERTRESAESRRVSSESGRALAESGRVSAESARVQEESARASAETDRASAESARAQAETAREAAQTAFFQGVSASAEMLPPESDATASAVPEGGSFHVSFGIPAGGPAGKSAYQYAVDGGYTGTEAEFQALMGAGPWLPAEDGVVITPVQLGDSEHNGKLTITGDYENAEAPLVVESKSEQYFMYPTQPNWGQYISVSGSDIVCTSDVNFTGRVAKNGHALATEPYVSNEIDGVKSELSSEIHVKTWSVTGPITAGASETVTMPNGDNYLKSSLLYIGQQRKEDFYADSSDYGLLLKSVTFYSGFYFETRPSDVIYAFSKDIPDGTTVDCIMVYYTPKS